MQKTAAIFLLSLYLFGATDAYQLLKLPLLVQHFIAHHHENPSISFISFMHLHYQDEIVIDEDFQEDMQLPFKTHETDCCLSMSLATLVPTPLEIKLQPAGQPQIIHVLFNDDILLFLSAPSIFQPPRA